MKYSSDAPSFSTASSNSSAVTPRSPVSIAETVCRSLKPNRRATLSWVRFRCSRSAPLYPAAAMLRSRAFLPALALLTAGPAVLGCINHAPIPGCASACSSTAAASRVPRFAHLLIDQSQVIPQAVRGELRGRISRSS